MKSEQESIDPKLISEECDKTLKSWLPPERAYEHQVQEQRYGFRWGPLTVERTCSDERYHMITIRTEHQILEVAVSPTGRSIRTNKRKAPKKHGCAGCGFKHEENYKDCAWNKNPY